MKTRFYSLKKRQKLIEKQWFKGLFVFAFLLLLLASAYQLRFCFVANDFVSLAIDEVILIDTHITIGLSKWFS